MARCTKFYEKPSIDSKVTGGDGETHART